MNNSEGASTCNGFEWYLMTEKTERLTVATFLRVIDGLKMTDQFKLITTKSDFSEIRYHFFSDQSKL